jgi:hypothetical protein
VHYFVGLEIKGLLVGLLQTGHSDYRQPPQVQLAGALEIHGVVQVLLFLSFSAVVSCPSTGLNHFRLGSLIDQVYLTAW